MPTDKRTESAHFKSFRHFAGESVPDGPVAHADANGEVAPHGAPDFLIAAPRRTIGIEHREVLKPRKAGERQRAHEQDADQVLRMAQELAELRALPIAHVTVLFARDDPIPKRDRLPIARALVEVVHARLPEDRAHVGVDCADLGGRELRSIERLHIHRDDGHKGRRRWVASRAGRVVANCVQLIQDAIDDKASKYSGYQEHCDECWLLLVADSFKPSATIHPDEQSLAHEYRSPFERTYFLDDGMGQLHVLRTLRE